jgi:RNA-binding protein 23/39
MHHVIHIGRYIEFYDAMSVPMAIALSGQLLLGQPVIVKPSEAEKNLVQSTASSSVSAPGGARKLYVGNLHANINEEQLRQVSVQIYYSLDLVP